MIITENFRNTITHSFGDMDAPYIINAFEQYAEFIINCDYNNRSRISIEMININAVDSHGRLVLRLFNNILLRCTNYRFEIESRPSTNTFMLKSTYIYRNHYSHSLPHETVHTMVNQGGRRLGHAGFSQGYFPGNKTNTRVNIALSTFVDYLAGLSKEQNRSLLTTAENLRTNGINCLITLNKIEDQAIIVSLAVTESSDKKNMWNLRIYDASETDAMSDAKIIEYIAQLNTDPLTRAPLVTQPARYSNFEELINILKINYLSKKKTYCGFKPGFLL